MNKHILSLITFIFTLSSTTLLAKIKSSNHQKTHKINGIEITSKKKTWKKDVWSMIEIDQKINSSLFLPYNKTKPAYNQTTQKLDLDRFTSEEEAIQWNLWTILVANVAQGKLTPYCPFDPSWEITKDNGYLNYPLAPTKENGNFENDANYENKVKSMGCLGTYLFDPYASPLMSFENPGEDSLIMDDDGHFNAVYPAPDFMWFEDNDIIAYEIKEEWTYNADGLAINKTISAIAPITNTINDNGEIDGRRALFWVDFSALKPILTNYFTRLTHTKKERILSLAAFFEEREFYGEKIEELDAGFREGE